MWQKIKTWWANSKLKPIWEKIGKAIRQFLRYAYAAQLSYLVLAVIIFLAVSKFLGVLLIAWGVVLLIAEIRQKKAEKAALEAASQPKV
jgi:asparagine N-glycosylation enzyme membrane subunit Stt3